MIQVVTNSYKDEQHPYENGFIHSRVIEYISHGIETEVFVLNRKKKKKVYYFEGVKVSVGDGEDLKQRLEIYKEATVCVHFLSVDIANTLKKIEQRRNVVVFVHGVEALKWEERIFPGVLSNWRSILGFCKYALVNSFSIPQLTDFLESTIHNIVFVAVSEWMKERAEVNWKCKKEWEWNVIPNIVNTDKFNYVEKSPSYVNKLLSIRPFTTGKYANDITVECISKLIKDFSYINIEATIIGKGPQYERIVSPIKNIPNINLVNRFLDSDEIISYHKKNGLFICPTRQDAQGVSMCEAMASGLVPITLYNTAIPEFLPNDERLVCHDVNDMIQLIIRLIQNPQEFLYLSKLCRSYIDKKCGYKETVEKEIELFKRLER